MPLTHGGQFNEERDIGRNKNKTKNQRKKERKRKEERKKERKLCTIFGAVGYGFG